ncbi:hypothetical protein MACK_001114 [Theileria orientalis]|uniref:Uncharacterized protein n=1 Tax=Theileria orientalis TaxID=68886 RepID=A0A976MEF0_THEOR|nr:hypothetical protein MACK_001114 [Theileria orientalis]
MNQFYDINTCRQFNMLGEYINCYSKVIEKNENLKDNEEEKTDRSSQPEANDEERFEINTEEVNLSNGNGEVDELFSEIDDLVSLSPISLNFGCSLDENDPVKTKIMEKRAVNYYDNVVLASKLKLANEQISQLQEKIKRSSDDYFKMEQMMKQIYYNDLRELKKESEEQIMDNKNKMNLLLQIYNENQQMWNDRKQLLNNVLNDYIVNINDCLAVKDLYDVFDTGNSGVLGQE